MSEIHDNAWYSNEIKKKIHNQEVSIDLISLISDTQMRVAFREFKTYNSIVEHFKTYDIVIVHRNGVVSRLLEDALKRNGVIVIPYEFKQNVKDIKYIIGKDGEKVEKKHLNIKHGEKLFAWIDQHWDTLIPDSKEIYEKL